MKKKPEKIKSYLDVRRSFFLVYWEVVILWLQKILQFLIVDLKVGQLNAQFSFLFSVIHTAEERIHNSRNHSWKREEQTPQKYS